MLGLIVFVIGVCGQVVLASFVFCMTPVAVLACLALVPSN